MKAEFKIGCLAVALIVTGSSQLLSQTTNNWTGLGSSANWSDASNWDAGALAGGEVLVFPVGPTALTSTNDTAFAFAGLDLNTNCTIYGNTLTIISNGTIWASKSCDIYNEIYYPDSLATVTNAAEWKVTGGANLGLHGNVNAPQPGSGFGISGYIQKTGNGKVRLVGTTNNFDSGINIKGGEFSIDGAVLNVTNQFLRVSGASSYGTQALLTIRNFGGNNANVTLGFDSTTSTTGLQLQFGDASATNICNMESGTLTILGRGFIALCSTVTDVAEFNHNGGVIDIRRDNGAGVQMISTSGVLATYNLNGGRLMSRVVRKSGSVGLARFNFNGGVLEHVLGGGVSLNQNSFMPGIDEANVLDGGAIFDCTVNTTVTNDFLAAGTGGLTKRGAGNLRMESTNQFSTFLGPVLVEEGQLEFRYVGALGNNTNTVEVLSNAVLYANLNGDALDNVATNNFIMQGGSKIVTKAGFRIGGDVTANGPFVYDVLGFSSIFGSVFSGDPSAAIIKTNTSTLQLTGTSTYTLPGSNVVEQGTMRLGGTGNYGTWTTVSGATLELSGTNSGAGLIQAGGNFKLGFNNNIAATVWNGDLSIENGFDGFGFRALTTIEIDSAANTNDSVEGIGTVTYGGDLTVTDVSGAPAYTLGQTFKLFSASAYAGSFNGFVVLPFIPDATLMWTNKLAIDGSIQVISTNGAPVVDPTPTDLVAVFSPTNVMLSWPASHIGWNLQVQTNSRSVGLSSTGWFTVPGSSTNNLVTLPISKDAPTVFYRLQYLVP